MTTNLFLVAFATIFCLNASAGDTSSFQIRGMNGSAISPDGKIIIGLVGDDAHDEILGVFDGLNGALEKKLNLHITQDVIIRPVFSSDSRQLFFPTDRATLQVFDTSSWNSHELKLEQDGQPPFQPRYVSANGAFIVGLWGFSSTLYLYDGHTGKILNKNFAQIPWAMNPDERSFFVYRGDGTIVRRFAQSQQQQTYNFPKGGSFASMVQTNGTLLMARGGKATGFFDITSGRSVSELKTVENEYLYLFSHRPLVLEVVGSDRGENLIKIMDLKGQVLIEKDISGIGENCGVTWVSFFGSDDSIVRFNVTCSGYNTMVTWNLKTATQTH